MGFLWVLISLFTFLWFLSRPNRSLCVFIDCNVSFLGPFGSLCFLVLFYGSLWVVIGPCTFLWVLMGP